MTTQTIVFSPALSAYNLPFTSGNFHIQDLKKDPSVNYKLRYIYIRFNLSDKKFSTRSYYFEELEFDNGYYKFPFDKAPDNCISGEIHLLPTVDKMIKIDLDYNY